MNNILTLEQKIIPEMVELLSKRYQILKSIYYNQPVGRRMLSQELRMGERIVRSEVNFLKEQDLIEINSIGMVVTKEGEHILESLQEVIHRINGLAIIEEKLAKHLGIAKTLIVPGDSDKDKTVLKEMGRIAANYIKGIIDDGSVIALTGGSSVRQVIESMPRLCKNGVTVVPARGGMGSDVETQANTLVEKLAVKLNAKYKLLHVPDNISHEALDTMLNEPDIKEIAELIDKADILIFGLAKAKDISIRRGLSNEKTSRLIDNGAVGEAFGYYFNASGEIIYKTPCIGISFEKANNTRRVIAVAGGKSKAEAIVSTRIQNPHMILITDEGAARSILDIK